MEILVVCFIRNNTLNISNVLGIYLAYSSNYCSLIQYTEIVDTVDIKQLFHEIHNDNINIILNY